MGKNKCLIILSEKSSGSSACQELIVQNTEVKHIKSTRHYENETLYWTKAASILNKNQLDMVDSEVPIEKDKAREDLITLLSDNIKKFNENDYNNDKEMIFEGWRMLCNEFSPIFIEKSPHHLCQWSALELMVEALHESEEVDYRIIGLIRNPMDTIYSQYSRWKYPPKKSEVQWIRTYTNLLKLKEIEGDKLIIIKYEDIVNSKDHLNSVYEFCNIEKSSIDNDYLHTGSIQKWRKDSLFGFTISSKTKDLAVKYGYSSGSMENDSYFMWPLVRNISRTSYKIKVLLIKNLKKYFPNLYTKLRSGK